MRILGVIPARYESTRLPGKPLVDIAGRAMVERVYLQAKKASLLTDVIVATDHPYIELYCRQRGINARMTHPAHQNGTERLLEVAESRDDYDAYINIQGDEPFIAPEQIDQVVALLTNGAEVATLVRSFKKERALDPNTIKVVVDNTFKALYFSRALIPYDRETETEEEYLQHIGIYGFSKATIQKLPDLKLTSYENREKLEQLRWMQNGISIQTAMTNLPTYGVDTAEDLERIFKLIDTGELKAE